MLKELDMNLTRIPRKVLRNILRLAIKDCNNCGGAGSHADSMGKSLGQGLNPHHRSHPSSNNAGFLTSCTTRELSNSFLFLFLFLMVANYWILLSSRVSLCFFPLSVGGSSIVM